MQINYSVLRYDEFRIDASSLKELPDGSIKVTGQLTRSGIFNYRNPDGSLRREYRPAEEVNSAASLATFAGAPVTINHPAADPSLPAGKQRLVSADTWKRDAVGHLGDNIRVDGGVPIGDFYVREAQAVAGVKKGNYRNVSLGYNIDYDPTPGTAPDGQRYDGVQRNMRGNHVALLPAGVAPRGGDQCVLRLDSAGDERTDVEEAPINYSVTPEQIAALNAQVTALTGELQAARTDAAEVATLRKSVATLTAERDAAVALTAPARLDSLVDERTALVAVAAANGVESKGLSALQIKRAVIAKRTPALAARVDSFSADTCDVTLAVYAELPHPTMAVLGRAPTAAPPARTDAADPNRIPTISELHTKAHRAELTQWKGV